MKSEICFDYIANVTFLDSLSVTSGIMNEKKKYVIF